MIFSKDYAVNAVKSMDNARKIFYNKSEIKMDEVLTNHERTNK